MHWRVYMPDMVTRLPGEPCLLASSTLVGGLSFCLVNISCRVSQLAEVRWPQRNGSAKLPFGELFRRYDFPVNVNCIKWLQPIGRVQHNNPRLWKAAANGTSHNKKLSFSPKCFFCPPSCLLCLVTVQKAAHRLWTGGQCFNPRSRVSRLVGHPPSM